jgi:hypothetical protein
LLDNKYTQTRLKPSPYLEDDEACPWLGLKLLSIPNFSDASDGVLERQLELDIPEDEKATGEG